jgi:hypothetical protein
MLAAGLLVYLAAAGVSAAPAAPPTPPTAVPEPPAAPTHRFRLALSYTRVVAESGSLGHVATTQVAGWPFTTQAVSLHWAFASSTYVRNHFALGYQWESAGPYRAHGLRADLISFGYPIRLVEGELNFAVEPIITPVRGEIVFAEGGDRNVLRMEGGVGLEFLLVSRGWTLGIEPLHVDFRYWVRMGAESRTGFAPVFPVRVAIGHEF